MDDLNTYVAKTDDITVTLKNSKGKALKNQDGSDMTITCYSPHSEEARNLEFELQDDRLKTARDAGEFEISTKANEEFALKRIVTLIKDWNITLNGEGVKFTKAKAEELVRTVPLIRVSVERERQKALDFT